MNRQWFMLDLEFTSLNPFEAHITEFGLVHFNPKTFEVIDTVEAFFPVLEQQWDPQTLEWARETYGEEGIAKYAITPDIHFSYSTYQRHRHAFTTNMRDILLQKIEKFGLKEVHIIVNHPEVDITILKHQFHKYAVEWPLHYQNIKDMDSLMMASGRATCHIENKTTNYYDQIWDHVKEKGLTKDKLTHTAVEDCLNQINLLAEFGVVLP